MPINKQHIFFTYCDWFEKWCAYQAINEAISKNEKVLYVPTFCNFPSALLHKKSRKTIVNWLKGNQIKKINENLTIFYPPPLFHFGRTEPFIRYNEKLVELNLKFLGWLTKKISIKMGFENPIIWTTEFLGHCFRSIFPDNLLIYYQVDDIRYSPRSNSKIIKTNERKIAQVFDLVIIVSKELRRRFNGYGAKTLLANIGVTSKSIKYGNIKSLPKINDLPGKKIGFLGNLASFIDYSLLEKIAIRFKNCQLVFVGPIERNRRLLESNSLLHYPNIKCFPTVDISDVPKVIAAFDVCILPFLRNEITLAADPIKMYDYLAGQKPIVAIKINKDMERYKDIAYLYETHEEFLKGIELSLSRKHPDTMRKKQLEFVKNNTWENVVSRIRNFIDEEFRSKYWKKIKEERKKCTTKK